MTTHRELRPTCCTPSSVSGGQREHLESWGLSIEFEPSRCASRPRRCLPRTKRAVRPLTPSSREGRAEARPSPPESRPPPIRQDGRFRTTQGAFHRRVFARNPRFHEASSNANPPPDSRVLPPGAGFRRSFAPCSEERELDQPLPCAHHARSHLATRRPSTSAIKTIHKHDLRSSESSSRRGLSTLSRLKTTGDRARCAAVLSARKQL